jgi:hypothetical protein
VAEVDADMGLVFPRNRDEGALRKEIEDLIGLDAYYRIEAETVEPDSVVR